jgi:hypothetical protein
VIFVTVGEDDTDDVVEAVLDRREVGKDEVDTGLGLFGEEHTAVDDEKPPIELEDGHVATNFAESAKRDDAK